MIDITDPRDCCGCTACASICGKDAIKMTPDAMGFLYPVVDTDLCVECGMCEKVCAFHDNYDRSLNLASPDAYAVRHKDMRQVETSRSGGAFIAFSDYVLAQGGVVYGAGYTDHFPVGHKRAVTSGERDEFKGSKYVQSDLTGIFRQVRDDLKSGRKVMFSGTPCQTSGLVSFIGPRLRANSDMWRNAWAHRWWRWISVTRNTSDGLPIGNPLRRRPVTRTAMPILIFFMSI